MNKKFSCYLESECAFADESGETRVLPAGTLISLVDGWNGDNDESIILHAVYEDSGELWTAEVPWDSLVPSLDEIAV